MAIVTLGAFVSGVAVGWVARGISDAPRNELVRDVANGYRVRDAVRRWVAGRTEWVEDLVAEGQAYYAATRRRGPAEDEARIGQEARVS